MSYKSNAEWPEHVYRGMDGSCISDDSHSSLLSAKAVCHLLMAHGFGGDEKEYPIRVWVTDSEGSTVCSWVRTQESGFKFYEREK